MKYVKLTVKAPSSWFKEGTEVYAYDSDYQDKKRITLEEYHKWVNDPAIIKGILVRGVLPDGIVDGEFCELDEFNMEIVEE
jgi:hypothetical protein